MNLTCAYHDVAELIKFHRKHLEITIESATYASCFFVFFSHPQCRGRSGVQDGCCAVVNEDEPLNGN